MAEIETYPALPTDDSPEDVGADVHRILANPTPEELEEGRRQGLTVSTDDDDDNGLGPLAEGARGGDRPAAMDEARKLKRELLKAGVPEVSIELVEGRPNSYGQWNALYGVSDMSHHVVSRLGSNLTPVLSLVKNGRSDLAGPLANGYGGWDLCYRIICMGYANHSGEGGPIRVPTTNGIGYTIPQDSARRYAFGTEYEGGLASSDWRERLRNPRTGDRMTMIEFMDRANAGIQNYLNIPDRAHLEHSTWAPNRKIDRLGISRREGIEGLRRFKRASVSEPTDPEPTPDKPQGPTRITRAHEHFAAARRSMNRGIRLLEGSRPGRKRVHRLVVVIKAARRAFNRAVRKLPDR